MNVLVISFYFRPDLGAGSFRASAIVDALVTEQNRNLNITVITTQPNRYSKTAHKMPYFEEDGNVSIYRIRQFNLGLGVIGQAFNFAFFAFFANRIAKYRSWNVVFATSSRLMTAVLGAQISKASDAKLFLDIRDLFPETFVEVFSRSPLRVLGSFFSYLERKTLAEADVVNVVSRGFLEHVRTLAPKAKHTVFTNGIDLVFEKSKFNIGKSGLKTPTILYAGNIGDGQGLEKILPSVCKLARSKMLFKVIGNGSKKNKLIACVDKLGLHNIMIFDTVSQGNLVLEYGDADILFLHLNDYKAFLKVLPSKLFEYAASGKPIVAGVSGYAREFIESNIEGSYIFDPFDAQAMQGCINSALSGEPFFDRKYFCEVYSRKNISKQIAQQILQAR